MKMSRRARRMDQHHHRHKRSAALNMVSLMDIFTILVFFLLVSASEVELITPPKDVALPESRAETKPEQRLTVTVSRQAILVNDRQVVALPDVAQPGTDSDTPLPTLQATLAALPADKDSQLTLLADRSTSYAIIKRVLLTCAAAGFENTALAVLQVAESSP